MKTKTAKSPASHSTREIKKLIPGIKDVLFTGSRAICPGAAEENSDWDFVCLCQSRVAVEEALKATGFEIHESPYGPPIDGQEPEFTSLKNGGLNLLLTESREFYALFHWRR